MWRSIFGLAAAFVLSVAILVGFVAYHSRVVDQACEKLRTAIDGGKLIGADPKTVIQFLDRKHISHSTYLRYPSNPAMREFDRTISAGPGEVDHTVGAHLLPGGVRVEIKFRFDENDRLKSYQIERIPIVLCM